MLIRLASNGVVKRCGTTVLFYLLSNLHGKSLSAFKAGDSFSWRLPANIAGAIDRPAN